MTVATRALELDCLECGACCRDNRVVLDDVVGEVKSFLLQRLAFAVAEGIAEERVMLDPGIGFGKTIKHNLELLNRLDELVAIGRPIVVGTSRKSFLGRLTGRPEPADRVPGTIATNVLAYERGARVFTVAAATVSARWTPTTPTSSTT